MKSRKKLYFLLVILAVLILKTNPQDTGQDDNDQAGTEE